MLRGCLLSLLMLAGIAVAYFYWLDQTFDRPASYWAAGIVGFFVLCCVGALMNGVRAWRDASRVAAASQLDLPLVEGRTVTVCGTIHPVAEALIAPFSHEPCIACEYDLTSAAKLTAQPDNANSGSDFAGFLMNPCVIRTPFRDVKLLGFPLLEGFSERRLSTYTAAGHARQFVSDTTFDDRSGLKIVSVLSVFGDVWADDDGLVRKNIRIGKVTADEIFPPKLVQEVEEVQRLGTEEDFATDEEDEEDDEEDWEEDEESEADEAPARPPLPKMVETRVEIGDKVCAIGVYDEVRGGLVPLSRGGQPNRLIRGDAETIIRKSRQAARGNLIGGLIFLVAVHVVLFGVRLIYTHSDEVVRERTQRSFDAVRNNDVVALHEVMRRGFDINIADSNANTLLHLSLDPQVTAYLIEHGADLNRANEWGNTPLIEAARNGRPEIAKQLLAAGADRELRNRVGKTAREEAEDRGFRDVVEVLVAAP